MSCLNLKKNEVEVFETISGDVDLFCVYGFEAFFWLGSYFQTFKVEYSGIKLNSEKEVFQENIQIEKVTLMLENQMKAQVEE